MENINYTVEEIDLTGIVERHELLAYFGIFNPEELDEDELEHLLYPPVLVN